MNAIQSLRFFTAFIIFLLHLNFIKSSSIYKNFFSEGFLGVTFFFILSGFILSYSYEKKIIREEVDYLDFIIARLARIFPTHIITLIIALPLSIGISTLLNEGLFTILTLGVNAFLLQSFIPISSVYFSMNRLSWSLSDLMFFYILFPFLVMFRTWKLILVSAFIIGYQLLILIYFSPHKTHDLSSKLAIADFLIYIFPLSRLLDFVIGIILYKSFYSKFRLSSAYSTLLQMVAILIFCGFFFYHQNVPFLLRLDLYYIIPLSLVIISFTFENGYFAKLIDNKLFVLFGSASFAFFMIHQLVIRYYELVHKYLLDKYFTSGEMGISSVFVCLVVSLLASVYLCRYFEINMHAKTVLLLSRIKRCKYK